MAQVLEFLAPDFPDPAQAVVNISEVNKCLDNLSLPLPLSQINES